MSEFIIDATDEVIGDDFNARSWFGPRLREEIVRCRDCEHAIHYHPLDYRTGKPHETLEEWYCTWHSNSEGASEIAPDGFCAWGRAKVVEE